jgi:hypothetical protein
LLEFLGTKKFCYENAISKELVTATKKMCSFVVLKNGLVSKQEEEEKE